MVNLNPKKMDKKIQRTAAAIIIAAATAESIVRPEERNFHTHTEYETPYNNHRIGLSVYNISTPIYTEYPSSPFAHLSSLF
jgi:hypothetical protein